MNGPESEDVLSLPLAETEAERGEREAFERALTAALRQVAAPSGLADAVQRRARDEEAVQRGKLTVMPTRPRWVPWGGAIAASLLAASLVGAGLHEHHERVEATREFDTATRITDQALEHTREQLARKGIPLGD